MAKDRKRVSRPTRGDEIIAWLEEYCRVPEGAHVGRKIVLRPWQREIIKGIYDSPTRRAIITFPRKNGKTALAALLLLVHLVGPEAERNKNSQIFSAAQSRDQAALVFNYAAKMVRASPDLSAHVVIRDTAKQLVSPEDGIVFRALSAETATAYGLSPAFVVHDELGQVEGPRSGLYDAIESAMGAHEAPLSIIISTQAAKDGDLFSMLIDDAKTGADPGVKLFMYAAPDDADIFDEKVWKAANPALGDFLSFSEFKSTADTAKRMPSAEATFRNLLLNQRIRSEAKFIPPPVWIRCGAEPDVSLFRKKPVFAALDLSSRKDLTAFVLTVEDDEHVWHVLPFFWTPANTLAERSHHDRQAYELWVKQGQLLTTPGSSVDFGHVVHDVLEIVRGMNVQAVAFDRWRIDEFQKELHAAGGELPLKEFGQGFKDMAPALDVLEADIVNQRLRHGKHPVLNMCVSNAIAVADPAGNRKLDKSKATGRIDGLVALVMARGIAAHLYEPPAEYSLFVL